MYDWESACEWTTKKIPNAIHKESKMYTNGKWITATATTVTAQKVSKINGIIYISTRSRFNSFILWAKKKKGNIEKRRLSEPRTPTGHTWRDTHSDWVWNWICWKTQNQPQTHKFNSSYCCQANSKYIVTCDFRCRLKRTIHTAYWHIYIYAHSAHNVHYIFHTLPSSNEIHFFCAMSWNVINIRLLHRYSCELAILYVAL